MEKDLPRRVQNPASGIRNRLSTKLGSWWAAWHSICEAPTARVLSVMTRQFTLLVVDDDLAVRESISRVLEAEGYQVSSAASCPDAIHEFDRRPVDMVLLDLNLGKEEGWRAFHALKERRPSLPIIVTSGRADELSHSSVKRASGALEKPFDVPVLLTLLKQASPTTSFHVSLDPQSGDAIASTENGRFPDKISHNVSEPEQLESAHSAQVVETKHQTPMNNSANEVS